MLLSEKSLKRSVFSFFIAVLFIFQCSADSLESDVKIKSYKYMKTINSVFDFVQQNYVEEVDPKVLYEGAMKGMLSSLGDPYTLYLDADAMRDLNDTTAGSFGGLGLYISKPLISTKEKPAYVEISSPMEDTPGSRAGLQSGDLITAINGEPTEDLTSDEVLARLRGTPGTQVTLSILRGTKIKFEVKLTRALIEVPTIKYSMIEGTSTGYVRMIQFTPDTAKRFQDALNAFDQANYTSLILDLRDNPGGIITSAVDVVDKFIDEGTIVDTKSRLLFENQTFSAHADTTTVKKGIPVIVLINHGSASASEIVSGALKDTHTAYLVGEKTYGKGSVQQVVPLSSTEGIKLTMARYYSPSDANIDKIGIPADLEVSNISIPKEQEEIYVNLLNSGIIAEYTETHQNMTEADVKAYAEVLKKEYPIEGRLLRRLIRVQLNSNVKMVYDLDFDLQLKAALDIINKGTFKELVKNTKTLKEIEEENAAKKAAESSK